MASLLEIDRLTPAEKLKLMNDLWDSLAANPDSLPVTRAEKAELERRSQEHRLDPGTALSEEEFRKRLAKRVSRQR